MHPAPWYKLLTYIASEAFIYLSPLVMNTLEHLPTILYRPYPRWNPIKKKLKAFVPGGASERAERPKGKGRGWRTEGTKRVLHRKADRTTSAYGRTLHQNTLLFSYKIEPKILWERVNRNGDKVTKEMRYRTRTTRWRLTEGKPCSREQRKANRRTALSDAS